MSKSQQLRKLQMRINELESDVARKDKIIANFNKRAKGELGDFLNKEAQK